MFNGPLLAPPCPAPTIGNAHHAELAACDDDERGHHHHDDRVATSSMTTPPPRLG
jgi:hypothetical protein